VNFALFCGDSNGLEKSSVEEGFAAKRREKTRKKKQTASERSDWRKRNLLPALLPCVLEFFKME
jgi:hypothetical protein